MGGARPQALVLRINPGTVLRWRMRARLPVPTIAHFGLRAVLKGFRAHPYFGLRRFCCLITPLPMLFHVPVSLNFPPSKNP